MNKITLIITSYPNHTDQKMRTYNLYAQDKLLGINQSTILKYPCIRQGCMTTCYVQANTVTCQMMEGCCSNCGNSSRKLLLDVGYKLFLDRHRKFIGTNQPLFVLLNPKTMEFLFSSDYLKNNLLSRLSQYIGLKIFKELNLQQTYAINNQILNFVKINEELSIIMSPLYKKKQYFLYSFCKYFPQPQQSIEQTKQLSILMFLYDEPEPLKVKLITESNSQICSDFNHYKKYAMIGYLGKQSTFIFAVPKNRETIYYASNINMHFNRQTLTLNVIQLKEWSDSAGRHNGSLIVDQNTSCVFVIGGYDEYKNQTLGYISCFLNCKWTITGNQRSFNAVIEKSHNLFDIKGPSTKNNSFSSFYKTVGNQNKIGFKNSTFMIYAYDRQDAVEKDKKLVGSNQLEKTFLNIGGSMKDSAVFSSGRFANTKPGIRYILYDPKSSRNPIIKDTCLDSKTYLNFCGNSYMMLELPEIIINNKKQYKSNALVFGGRKSKEQNNQKNEHYQKIYLIDARKMSNTILFQQKFIYGQYMPLNTDSFVTILKEDGKDQDKQFYLRATYPLDEPIFIKGKNGFVHYIVIEFGLTSRLFFVKQGFLPIVDSIDSK